MHHVIGWQVCAPCHGVTSMCTISWGDKYVHHFMGWQVCAPCHGVTSMCTMSLGDRYVHHVIGWQVCAPCHWVTGMCTMSLGDRYVHHVIGWQVCAPCHGVCCIVFDIDGMLFDFFLNFLNIEMCTSHLLYGFSHFYSISPLTTDMWSNTLKSI